MAEASVDMQPLAALETLVGVEEECVINGGVEEPSNNGHEHNTKSLMDEHPILENKSHTSLISETNVNNCMDGNISANLNGVLDNIDDLSFPVDNGINENTAATDTSDRPNIYNNQINSNNKSDINDDMRHLEVSGEIEINNSENDVLEKSQPDEQTEIDENATQETTDVEMKDLDHENNQEKETEQNSLLEQETNLVETSNSNNPDEQQVDDESRFATSNETEQPESPNRGDSTGANSGGGEGSVSGGTG